MDETTEAEPEEAEEGIASGAEKDVNSAAVEEKEEEPKQGGEMLFYIDVGANEKTKKTMQVGGARSLGVLSLTLILLVANIGNTNDAKYLKND